MKTSIFASTAAERRHRSIGVNSQESSVGQTLGHSGSCTSQQVPVAKLLQSLSLSRRFTTCENRDSNGMHPLGVGKVKDNPHQAPGTPQPPASTTCAPLSPAEGSNRVLETGNQSQCQRTNTPDQTNLTTATDPPQI